MKDWLKGSIVSSKLASGLSGKQSTMLGQEGGGPEEGKAEGGGTKAGFRDTLEVTSSEFGQAGLFWTWGRQFGLDIELRL